jgi:glycosyltransferase involved in cell wall biosynthesis
MGNPNLKTGGLNRYCKDLSESQRLDGHTIFILYPEAFMSSKRPHIVKAREGLYTIHDALPMAITYGIDSPERYMVSPQKDSFVSFLTSMHPDVIHVHSIQGIHKEFFEAARKLNIPMLFTTHDYYPICPRCVLLNSEGKICTEPGPITCAYCNKNAGLPANKQRVIQSDLYQSMKNSMIMRKLKACSAKSVQAATNDMECYDENNPTVSKLQENTSIEEFKRLREYYNSIMHCMSLIHCNSSVTFDQYSKYYPDIPMKTVPITHAGLIRSIHKRENDNILNISYMGGMSLHKGYRVLMEAVDVLNHKAASGWKLWLYGGEYVQEYKDERIQYKGLFGADEENEVWANTDVLIFCSQCIETFGFIVLEALSRGIPVLCSDLVGSKDLVVNVDEQLVFQHDNADELAGKIEHFLDAKYYKHICEKINDADIEVEMELHCRRMTELYKEIIT